MSDARTREAAFIVNESLVAACDAAGGACLLFTWWTGAPRLFVVKTFRVNNRPMRVAVPTH